MSIIGDIARNALRGARASLGTDGQSDEIKIDGGEPWKVTRNEERRGRDFELGGQQVNITLAVVGETYDFDQAYQSAVNTYLGQLATMNGNTYRIADIEKGEVFTTLALVGEEEPA